MSETPYLDVKMVDMLGVVAEGVGGEMHTDFKAAFDFVTPSVIGVAIAFADKRLPLAFHLTELEADVQFIGRESSVKFVRAKVRDAMERIRSA